MSEYFTDEQVERIYRDIRRLSKATRFLVWKSTHPFFRDVVIEDRGSGRWAVLYGTQCLSKSGEMEYEAMPSSRDEDFLKRCRFDDLDSTWQAAEELVKKIRAEISTKKKPE